MELEVRIKTFEELSLEELYELLQLRSEVFVVEQNCIYQDIDGKDKRAYHALGIHKDEVVAYARIFSGGDYFENPAIGRVVVSNSLRKSGFGKVVVEHCIKYVDEVLKAPIIELSAQTYLKRFYKELGFITVGEEYMEDGIPHIKMKRTSS